MPVVSAYCPNCGRRVYVGERDERVCPVCTGPLDIAELDETRAERIGRNEAMFREVNERIADRDEDGSEKGPELLVCECSVLECTQRIAVRLSEYDAIRSHPNRYAIAPDHDTPEVEVVIDKLPRYWIVAKNGPAAEAAQKAEAQNAGD